jgi:hypothetical protein
MNLSVWAKYGRGEKRCILAVCVMAWVAGKDLVWNAWSAVLNV